MKRSRNLGSRVSDRYAAAGKSARALGCLFLLLMAVEADAVDVVEAVLQTGADINIENEDGQSALAIANELGYEEIIDLLEQYGATPLSE